ncbi:glycoside hydrolase family 47 protein [Hypoxylon rubiginosum]|uniref:Glycoside hydrolase family 47 protein n=1 Tax=Hypoxylon rubiginosum TaxID=110542 RepID=A0ACC0DH56_9PEZI|nr:glycoside hydrolase family 47 protein [Hypoxylon rubiginosum]
MQITMATILRRSNRFAVIVFCICALYLFATLLPRYKEEVPKPRDYAYVPSSFDWSSLPQRHPVPDSEIASLPKGKPRDLPKVQFAFKADKSSIGKARAQTVANRRSEVKDALLKTWTSYKKHAWMSDELTPVSGKGKNVFGGWAATLVDTLDTLWIMDLRTEFYEAVAAVGTIDWAETDQTACNFFETTIRHLGGLLSAYDLSGETVLLRKAIELGDMLYTAFDTSTRMPPFWFDFNQAKEGTLRPGTRDPSAAVTSSCLEFTRLAQITGENKYYDAIDRITRLLDRTQSSTRLPGMWPTFFDMVNLQLTRDNDFTFGALADSLYEMFPKMYALLGGLEPVYEKLYRDAMETATKHLLFRPMVPDQADILFSGNAYVSQDSGVRLHPEGQHLACFVGGMYGLGGKLFNVEKHIEVGEKVTRGCIWAYDSMPTGIMPEIFGLLPCPTLEACEWDEKEWEKKGNKALKKGFQNARDPRYLLRPEAIESVFMMYRITGNPEYQDAAWRMFQSIRKATETELAFSAISDVTAQGDTAKSDSMESFWPAETLKYFYLIFSPPDVISLDEYVFNTEAHPLKRP